MHTAPGARGRGDSLSLQPPPSSCSKSSCAFGPEEKEALPKKALMLGQLNASSHTQTHLTHIIHNTAHRYKTSHTDTTHTDTHHTQTPHTSQTHTPQSYTRHTSQTHITYTHHTDTSHVYHIHHTHHVSHTQTTPPKTHTTDTTQSHTLHTQTHITHTHAHTHPEDLPFSYRMINVSPAPSSSWTTRETAQAQLELVTPLVGWVVVVGEFLHLTTILPSAFSSQAAAV